MPLRIAPRDDPGDALSSRSSAMMNRKLSARPSPSGSNDRRALLVWRLRGCALAALAAMSGGCATSFAHARAGAVVGTSGTVGGSVEGSYGVGLAGVGFEAAVRTKFTPDVVSGALGGGLFVADGGTTGGPLVWGHLGVHALQLDVIDETPYVSAFSPYLTGGIGICVDGCASPSNSTTNFGVTTSTRQQTVLTLGLAAEYDVRFVRAGEGFFGLTVGFAFYSQQNTRVPFL